MRVNARNWLTATMAVAFFALLTLAVSSTAGAATGPTDWASAPERLESPIKDVIGGIRRPEVGSHTDSYLYSSNIPFGTDVKFWISMDPNGYSSPVTMYVYKMNRANGQKRYYNINTGFTTTEADLFGSGGTPIQIKAPTLDNFLLFGNGGSALGAIPAESTGQYQLVVELRDGEGDKVVSFTNAMYNFVDQVIPKQGSLGSETWTRNNGYILDNGGTFVGEGQTLTIEAGTFVIAAQGSPTSLLVVRRGGKINANGTNVQPIIFTSENVWSDRISGDWGGLVINGAAPTNQNNPTGEGDSGPYGGDNANDSSGTLRYVRVEYGGRIFSADDELNGIAFQGVGAGTTLEFIQVVNGKDDGVEFFGGTVNAKNVIVVDAQDDSLDWTFGWTGTIENVCLIQLNGPSERLIEGDNFEDNTDATPRSKPTIRNITGRMNPNRGSGALAADGFRIRRGSDVVISNARILNVPSGDNALDFQDGSEDRCAAGTGNCSFSDVVADGPGGLTNLDPAPAGMGTGNARIANASSLIQFDIAPLSGSGGCTSAGNDWVKDYWVTTDIGPLN